jgi:hypothetical protein
MTDPGDSGALIISSEDDGALGLNFAGGTETTIANPLYKIEWNHVGSRRFLDGRELPMFETVDVPHRAVSTAGSERRLTPSLLADAPLRPLGGPLPSFVYGKAFLGTVRGYWSFRDRTFSHDAPPPPATPGVTSVDVIPGGPIPDMNPNFGTSNSYDGLHMYFLCFG